MQKYSNKLLGLSFKIKALFSSAKCFFVCRHPVDWIVSVYKRLINNVLYGKFVSDCCPSYIFYSISTFAKYLIDFPQFRFGPCGLQQGTIVSSLNDLFGENLVVIPLELLSRLSLDFCATSKVFRLRSQLTVNASDDWSVVLPARLAALAESLYLDDHIDRRFNLGYACQSPVSKDTLVADFYDHYFESLLRDQIELIQSCCSYDLSELGYYEIHSKPVSPSFAALDPISFS